MTYEEQLKIEQLNKEIINNIINTVMPEDFINFYLYHNQKETMAEYGLRTVKQLTKILTIFNYDFSKPKPSKFKGKQAVRSHESYLAGGKKSSDKQKQAWKNKTEEEKSAWAIKQQKTHSAESFKNKIRQINIDYNKSLTPEQKAEKAKQKSEANKKTWTEYKKDILQKAYNTKKANNSFSSSQPEEKYYQYLLNNFAETDIIKQYKDERYRHACDFYIKSLDLFIELNFSWTHGLHKFNAVDAADLKKLSIWQEKAQTSDYYKKAIDVWTRLDAEKFADAEKHKLNYLVFYTEDEAFSYEF